MNFQLFNKMNWTKRWADLCSSWFKKRFGKKTDTSTPIEQHSTMELDNTSQPNDSLLNNTIKVRQTASSKPSVGGREPFTTSPFVEQCLLEGDVDQFVSLPKYIKREEWIAAHGTFLVF